jgi:hypothetical protein
MIIFTVLCNICRTSYNVAVYTTVVTPFGKEDPGLCVAVRVTPGQLSEAVGAVQVTLAAQVPGAVLAD